MRSEGFTRFAFEFEHRTYPVYSKGDRTHPAVLLLPEIAGFSPGLIGERPHATFTKEYRLEPAAAATHHSRQALADVIAFLDRHIRTASPRIAAG